MTGYDAYAACLTSLDLTDGDISSSSNNNQFAGEELAIQMLFRGGTSDHEAMLAALAATNTT
eukprot:CAMPEP_0119558618 /NCGR_PEP_ID=MMETSP1352-20130426/10902_1 /TAXON_ID=265584 /ORGANISM="Stauroneis constricta, Strain CCMP1120" /LENGTH=61 /DNA_ID=CAMNT_0007606025 /DNA_START=122 /DNA_END=305 /DNA_ORIENTATION=+